MVTNQALLSTINNSINNTPIVSICIYLAILAGLFLGFTIWRIKTKTTTGLSLTSTIYHLLKSIQWPIFLLIVIYVGYILLALSNHFFSAYSATWIYRISTYILHAAEYLTYFLAVLNIYNAVMTQLLNWLKRTDRHAAFVITSTISHSLNAAIWLLMIIFFIPLLGITGLQMELLEKITKLLLISTIGWIFLQVVDGIQKLIIQHINHISNNGIKVRTINTQVLLLKKIIQAIIIVVTIAAGLMTFESVRSLGTGLLTTAGIVGAVGAFASQHSLSRLFNGLQLAFSQPIRMGDAVIIDNELGEIEEITLSYVVVKLWDLRRLILPTDYFFTKGLLNLTRNSTELLGTIFIYADYTLPIDVVRKMFFEYLESSPFWNKQTANFQVTDIKEHTLELRGLVSANDGPSLWNLRCEVREKLIKFIVDNYPNSLPIKRNMTV